MASGRTQVHSKTDRPLSNCFRMISLKTRPILARPLTIPGVDLTSFDSSVLKSVTVRAGCALRYLLPFRPPLDPRCPSPNAPAPARAILIMPGDNDRARATDPLIGRQIAGRRFLVRGTSVPIDRTEIDRRAEL
jgi:hypothetical protein